MVVITLDTGTWGPVPLCFAGRLKRGATGWRKPKGLETVSDAYRRSLEPVRCVEIRSLCMDLQAILCLAPRVENSHTCYRYTGVNA